MGELKHFFKSINEHLPNKLNFPKDVPVPDPTFKWLNEKQQDEVYEFLKDPIFIFMRYTGCRPNEARGLLWSAIDPEKKQIFLKSVLGEDGKIRNRTKTGKLRVLPLIPEIAEILDYDKRVEKDGQEFVFTNGKIPYSRHMLEKRWMKANRLAHRKYKTPIVPLYSGTKHSFATQRLAQGWDLYKIAEILGHSDIKSTKQ